jgi:hypothetical protein
MVQMAVPGLSKDDGNGEVMKHCSERCLQEYSTEGVTLPIQTFQPPLRVEEDKVLDYTSIVFCILRVTKMIEMAGGAVAKVTVNLCLDSDYKTPMVLVHIRTHLSQQIFEFVINESLEPMTQPLPHLQSFGIFRQVETADIVNQLLQPALLQIGHSGLNVFLAHTRNAMNL